jgi:very-short-patch-repair endonuclease
MHESSPFGPDGVAHRRDLGQRSVSVGRIRRAIASGRWQEPVPGVVVSHGGPLSRRQRRLVGLAHAGADGCLSHTSALLALGARVDEPIASRRAAGVRGLYVTPADGGLVEVSVPHGRHLRSSGFVVVHQSRRPLRTVSVAGMPSTGAARSSGDVALTADRRSDVDHVISHVLQRRLTDVEQLVEETVALGRSANSWLRAAVQDAVRGMRSVGEADLRRVIRAADLPEPEWNAEIVTAGGTFAVDALWRRRWIAVEADGAAFHLSAEDWAKDLERQNCLVSTGLRLLRFPVRRLRARGAECGLEMRALLR